MKWIALTSLAIAGFHALISGNAAAVPDDRLVAAVCGTGQDCIRRHNAARRAVLAARWRDPADPLTVSTRACPSDTWVRFQTCYDHAAR